MKPKAVRFWLIGLYAAAIVVPALAAWQMVRLWQAERRTPQTLGVDVGAVFLDPARPQTWGTSHRFEFINPSRNATARLSLAYKSCGCSACVIERTRLAPGERGQILLSMSVPYFRQDRHEWAIIDTGLGVQDELIVSLTASFYPRIMIDVDPLSDAELAPGSTHTLQVTTTAYQPAREKPGVLRLACTEPRARVNAAGPTQVLQKDGVRRVMRRWDVHISGSSPNEASAADTLVSGELVASYGRWRTVRELAWTRKSAITATPAQVVLQPDKGGTAAAVVLLESQQAFAILGIEASEGLQTHHDGGGQQTLHELTIQAAWDTGAGLARKGQIVITTDHARQPRVVLPVYVLYAGT